MPSWIVTLIRVLDDEEKIRNRNVMRVRTHEKM